MLFCRIQRPSTIASVLRPSTPKARLSRAGRPGCVHSNRTKCGPARRPPRPSIWRRGRCTSRRERRPCCRRSPDRRPAAARDARSALPARSTIATRSRTGRPARTKARHDRCDTMNPRRHDDSSAFAPLKSGRIPSRSSFFLRIFLRGSLLGTLGRASGGGRLFLIAAGHRHEQRRLELAGRPVCRLS